MSFSYERNTVHNIKVYQTMSKNYAYEAMDTLFKYPSMKLHIQYCQQQAREYSRKAMDELWNIIGEPNEY